MQSSGPEKVDASHSTITQSDSVADKVQSEYPSHISDQPLKGSVASRLAARPAQPHAIKKSTSALDTSAKIEAMSSSNSLLPVPRGDDQGHWEELQEREFEEALELEAEFLREEEALRQPSASPAKKTDSSKLNQAPLVLGNAVGLGSSQDESEAAPVCQECGAQSLDNQMLTLFNEAICRNCKLDAPGFKMLTKTKAKEIYLVTDEDMRTLPFVEAANPRRAGWTRMKLYITKHVERIALRRWKSLEGLAAEQKRREVDRLKRREAKAKSASQASEKSETDSALKRNIARLRGELGDARATSSPPSPKKKRSSNAEAKAGVSQAFTPINEAYHEHMYGEEVPVENEEDVYVKSCVECGFQVRFESL